MDVQVECCANVGMSQQDAHGLIVALAFNAACREAVAQPVEFQRRDIQLGHEALVVVPVTSRLYGPVAVGEHEEIPVHHLLQRPDHLHEIPGHRHFPHGVPCLWSVEYQFSMTSFPFEHINSPEGSPDMYRTPFNVDVGPGKGTYLPDPQSGAQADVDAEVSEGEVRHEVVHDLLLVRTCQDLEAAGAAFGGEADGSAPA